MTLTEIAIKRPTLIVVIFTVLIFMGIVSYFSLNYELFPKYSQPVLVVVTAYPGASPSEVENSVTKKIEDAISSLEDIDNIQSTSSEGNSVVVVIFKNSADMDKATEDATRKVANIEYLLPEDVKRPIISNFSMDDIPIMRLGLTAGIPSTELYDLVKNKIKPMISTINGISQVDIVGGEEREIRINVDNNKLKAHGISILQITQAIRSANMEFPTGKIKDQSQEVIIRLSGKFVALEDLKNLVIKSDAGGSPVRLEDVADVSDSKKETVSINRFNGQTSLGLLIFKQPDGNEVEISKNVKQAISKIEGIYQAEKLQVAIANDTSEFTLTSANAVMKDLLIAICLVALVMLVFLHSLRNSFIVLVAIPASLISTFTAMYLFNFSLNIISLVAMSLVIGILVDDSIVVLENIYRHLDMGKERRKAALDGRNEINYTAVSITLVDVVVFLPIALISSMVSGLLRQFSLVVVFSTLLSLFVSFTITPLLASRMAKKTRFREDNLAGRIILGFERWLHSFTEGYSKVVAWSLRHKVIVIAGTTVLFFASLSLVIGGFIGSEFVSMGDRGEVIIQMELPKNASIEQTNQLTLKAEQYLMKQREVISVFTSVGSTTSFFEAGNTAYKSEMHVKMVAKEKREITSELFAIKMKKDLMNLIPGVKVRSTIVSLMGTSDMDPIQIVLSGPNLDTLTRWSEVVMAEMKKVPGTYEVKLSVEAGNPEVDIRIDKDKMASLGLSTAVVGMTLQNAFSGNTDAKFREGDNEYNINVLLDQFDRNSINDIAGLSFVNDQGKSIQLNQFATIRPSSGTTILQRYDRVPSVTVQCQVIGRPVGSVGEDVLKVVHAMPMPKEVTVIAEGDMKYQTEAFGSMGIAFLASILFVYLIMVALYDSYVYPFVVIFSIPLAIIGALLALGLTMQSLTVFSILGIIMLVGLVGKNAILLVDFTNQLKEEGYNTFDALIQAGKVRMRPILMTTFSMIFGMLPIALASGAGSEWKNGTAWALIGGLTSSLFLTLIVVPVVYLYFDKLKTRWSKKKPATVVAG
ncbi:MAG TPA: efflux RND transporter permease subunit [Bacteroidales bacterium]|nr:efflux RND transporter permease subunit [Bacteroidales bacterium]HPS50232.1 efflux RND transporter permease subunit [Bacteroidales bacterium]